MSEAPRPLYVDLDGTLIQTDILHESMLGQIRKSPASVFPMLSQMARGRAQLKDWLSQKTIPAATTLPYRQCVLEEIKTAKEAGRRVVLVTASHQRVADAVGSHLGIFDEVKGSDETTNLKSKRKLEWIRSQVGENGEFEYMGDSAADLPIFSKATKSVVVTKDKSLVRKAKNRGGDVRHLSDPAQPSIFKMIRKIMRLHQWAKNSLIFLPAILAHQALDKATLIDLLIAFVAFGLCASSVYVMNDLIDIDSDRSHRTKSRRPFASGGLPVRYGPMLIVAFLGGGLALSATLLTPLISILLLGYVGINLFYTFWLKSQLLIDVFILAGLFTWRIFVGGVVADVEISQWLFSLSLFSFTSLAFVKRYTELAHAAEDSRQELSGRGYRVSDLSIIESVGPGAGYLSVLVMALYLSSDRVSDLYPTPKALWFVIPLLLYWFTRIWFLARRDEIDDDPIVWVIKDHTSKLVIALIVGCGIMASIRF